MTRAIRCAVIALALALVCLFIPTAGVELGGQESGKASKEGSSSKTIPPKTVDDLRDFRTKLINLELRRVPSDGTQNRRTLLEEYTVIIDESGKELLHGRYRRWIPVPYMLIEDSWFAYGKKHGKSWRIKHPDTLLTSGSQYKYEEREYVSGRQHGYQTVYRQDGGIIMREYRLNNKLEGPMIWYHDNGMPSSYWPYKNNKIVGKRRFYYKSGALASETPYENDYRSGWGKSWHENGRLSSEGNFVDGYPHGEWKYWDDEGNLTKRTIYEKGIVVKTIIPKK